MSLPQTAAPPHAHREADAMIRLACDSDQLDALIPTPLIFTYADLVRDRGHLHALRARFPGSTLKLIDRGLGDPAATAEAVQAVDEEPGANSIDVAAEKLLQLVKEGRQYVTGYADRNDMPKLVAATQRLGLTEMEWWKWYATLDGTMRVEPDPVAMVQFASSSMVGLHVDMSVIWHSGYHPEAR